MFASPNEPRRRSPPRRRPAWRRCALVAALTLGCKPDGHHVPPAVTPLPPVAAARGPVSPRYSLEQLLDPAPCQLSPEARETLGPAGADADSALTCGICPQVVLASGELLACELPFEADARAVSLPVSHRSGAPFHVTFGSFTKPNSSQAVVVAHVDEHDAHVRYFLMERSERRWTVLRTWASRAVPHAPAPSTLRDTSGRHLLIGVFQTDVPLRLDVRALRLSDEHLEAVTLLGVGDCSEPSSPLANRSQSNDRAIGIRATATKLVVHAQWCPTRDAPRKRSPWVDLQFEYDGSQFTATRPTRAALKLERNSLDWQTSD